MSTPLAKPPRRTTEKRADISEQSRLEDGPFKQKVMTKSMTPYVTSD